MTKNSISKNIFWNSVSTLLLQGLAFFTAPIFTRLLSPADYGQVSTYNSWVSFVSLFIGLQTYGTIGVAHVKFPERDFNSYLSSIMTISFLSFIFLFSISIVTKDWLAVKLGFPSFFIPLIVLDSFFGYCIGFYNRKLIKQHEIIKNNFIVISKTILTIALSLWMVISTTDKKYISKILANNIVVFIFGSILFFLVMIRGKCFYKASYWKFCLNFCLPLILHGAAGIIFTQSDKVMLKKIIGESETGIYSVVYTLALVINLLWTSFNNVWTTYYYDYKKSEDVASIRTKSKNYMLLFSILTIGFILLAPDVFKILAPQEYWSGLKLIPLIAVSYYFNFLYSFPANYEFYNEKTKIIAIGSSLASVINIILNYILIPKFAGLGAAIATLISYIFMFLMHEFNVRFVLNAKDFDYKFDFYLKGLIPVLCTAVFYYEIINLWILRWGIAIVLGAFISLRIIKNKEIL